MATWWCIPAYYNVLLGEASLTDYMRIVDDVITRNREINRVLASSLYTVS